MKLSIRLQRILLFILNSLMILSIIDQLSLLKILIGVMMFLLGV